MEFAVSVALCVILVVDIVLTIYSLKRQGKHPVTVVDDATEAKFGVKCFNCGGMIDAEKETLDEAVEAWNRRVSDEHRKGNSDF